MSHAFAAFYESWLKEQENFLKQLLVLSSSSSSSSSSNRIDKEKECNALVGQVLCHYKEFHEEKAKVMIENPFVMLCPPWLSSFEITLLWFSGFKPSIVFPLAKKALEGNLSNDQAEKIEMMRADTRREEKEIEKEMASLQESVAAPPLLDLIRGFERLLDGERSELVEAMGDFKKRVIVVLEVADTLRGSTATKLLEILSPFEAVQFLAAAVQFTIQTRKWGIEYDLAQNGDHGASTLDA